MFSEKQVNSLNKSIAKRIFEVLEYEIMEGDKIIYFIEDSIETSEELQSGIDKAVTEYVKQNQDKIIDKLLKEKIKGL